MGTMSGPRDFSEEHGLRVGLVGAAGTGAWVAALYNRLAADSLDETRLLRASELPLSQTQAIAFQQSQLSQSMATLTAVKPYCGEPKPSPICSTDS